MTTRNRMVPTIALAVGVLCAGCPRGGRTHRPDPRLPRRAVHEVAAAERAGKAGAKVTIGYVRRGTQGAQGTLLVLGGPHCIEWFGLALEPSWEVVYFSPSPSSLLLSERVKDVEAVRRKIGRRVVWVFGHSENGAVALEYAAAHRRNVAGLIWVAGLNDHPRSLSLEFRMLAKAADTPGRQQHYTALAAQKTYSVIDLMLSLQSRKLAPKCHFPERCRRAFVRAGSTIRKLGYHRTLAAYQPPAQPSPKARIASLVTPDLHGQTFLDYRSRVSASKRLSTLPVLMIQGGKDTVVHPETTRALRRHLPKARLVELPGCGHVPFVEQPERFRAELCRFLGVPAGQAPAASPLGAGWRPPYLAGAAVSAAALDKDARAASARHTALRVDAMLAAACRLFGKGTPAALLQRIRATPAQHRAFLQHHCAPTR